MLPVRRAAIFDLDGTLVDSAPSITRALNRLRTERSLPFLDVEQVRRWVSLGAAALVGLALDRSSKADAGEVAAFRAAYTEHLGTPEDLYPGIAEALVDLRNAGVVLGVCTNKPQSLAERVLTATGIATHFVAVIGGDAVPHAKPDGEHVLHTLDAMGYRGLPFNFIGDSYIDALAGQASGARFLWAAWGYAGTKDLSHYGRKLTTGSELCAAILETVHA